MQLRFVMFKRETKDFYIPLSFHKMTTTFLKKRSGAKEAALMALRTSALYEYPTLQLRYSMLYLNSNYSEGNFSQIFTLMITAQSKAGGGGGDNWFRRQNISSRK